MNSQNTLKPVHLLLSVLAILSWVVALSYLQFQFLNWDSPLLSFVVSLGILATIAIACYFATSSMDMTSWLSVIGLSKLSLNSMILAAGFAVILFVIDALLQFHLFNLSLENQAVIELQKINSHNWTLVFLISCLMIPFTEEMLFRGLMLRSLEKHISVFLNSFINALIFAAVHFSLSQSISLLIAGLIYCFMTFYFKSLWPAILAHVLNNTMTLVSILYFSDALI